MESAHAKCVHENTKAARALCRREHVVSNTDMVVTHAFVFVREARAQGFVNKLERITLDEVAQEHGITKWDYKLAEKMVLDRAYLMSELDLLGDDMLALRRVGGKRRSRR
jgi:hypothetical protein